MHKLPIILLACISLHACSADWMTADHLKTHFLPRPAGIDQTPGFSWQIRANHDDLVQDSYQIKVIDPDGKVIWNSGDVTSGISSSIQYQGAPLNSNTEYHWQVRVRDNHGHDSGWSDMAFFHTGLLQSSNIKAQWIMHPQTDIRSPLFARTFQLSEKPATAYAYVSALGYYELYVSGRKIDNRVLAPASSEYPQAAYYNVVDLAQVLQTGENSIMLWAGEGAAAFKRLEKDRFYNGPRRGFFDRPAVFFQLEITDDAKVSRQIVSDQEWKSTASPLAFNNIHGGETYDARLETQMQKALDQWANVEVFNYAGTLKSEQIKPVKVMQTLQPVEQLRDDNGALLYDFGTTIAGWWRIKVKGEPGDTLIISGAEEFGGRGFPEPLIKGKPFGVQKSHGEKNYYGRNAYTKYILKGGAEEIYEPRFFFTGFRYLQIIADNPDIALLSVEARHVHNDYPQTGDFNSSDPYLNQLHDISVLTFKNVTNAIPLSNPHSEKFGWTGDVHLFSEAANYSIYMPSFWKKWLADTRDAQQTMGNGALPETIPNHRSINYPAEPAWGGVYPMLVWEFYRMFGDRTVLEDNTEALIKLCHFYLDSSERLVLSGKWGDHLAPSVDLSHHRSRGLTPDLNRLINTAYFYHIVRTTAKIATELDKEQDALSLNTLADEIKRAFNNTFYDPKEKLYRDQPGPEGYDGFQTSQLVPLQFGLVPDGDEQVVFEQVRRDITDHRDFKFYTGILGTKALIDVLLRHREDELLYKLIKDRRFPGWGYMLEQGATSLWQDWAGDAGDFNHAMFGSVNLFMYKSLAGIDYDFSGSKRKITIRPFFAADLNHVSAVVPTVYGDISSHWERNGDSLVLQVEVPANTRAAIELELPDCGSVQQLSVSDGTPINKIECANLAGVGVRIHSGSGEYRFLF